jgi:hypothetical protein
MLVALLALILAGGATAAVTQTDAHGTVVIDGNKVFPIVLAKGPERGSTTPDGADGLDEVVDAGVNLFKVGPATDPWARRRQTGRGRVGPRGSPTGRLHLGQPRDAR